MVFPDSGFSQISMGIIYCAMLCNQLRSVVQSFSESVLAKQFSTLKAQFFSITMFISVLELEVNGYLRKSIFWTQKLFLYLETIKIMTEIIDQTKHRTVKRRHEEDMKPWKNWKRKSSLKTFSTVVVPTNRHCDLLEFLLNTKNDIHDIIAEKVGVRGALKFYLTVRPQLSRTDPDGNEKISTPYLCSTPSIVLQSSDIHEQTNETGNRFKHLLDIHEAVDLGSVSIVSWNVNSI